LSAAAAAVSRCKVGVVTDKNCDEEPANIVMLCEALACGALYSCILFIFYLHLIFI